MKQPIATKVVAGMIDDHSIEFFMADNKNLAMFKGVVTPIADLPDGILSKIEEYITPEVGEYLTLLNVNGRISRIEKFLSCRYGSLDFTADFADGELKEPEYWHCPNRGKCPVENRLCKLPRDLSEKEIEYIKLVGNDFSDKIIADKMGLSPKTVEKISYKVRNRLNIFSSRGIAAYAALNNFL